MREGGYGAREIIVRVNALATAWGQADLAAVAAVGAHAVLIPKVESADAVRQALASSTMPAALGSADLVHDGDPARHAARRGDRYGRSARRLSGHGHVRSGQGTPRRAYSRASAHDHRSRPVSACRARLRSGDPGRGPSGSRGRGGVRSVVSPGSRARLRRQDPDPSQADRSRQCSIRPDAAAVAAARRIIEAHEQAARAGQAWWWSMAGWSRTCTWSRRVVRCNSPKLSRRWVARFRPELLDPRRALSSTRARSHPAPVAGRRCHQPLQLAPEVR